MWELVHMPDVSLGSDVAHMRILTCPVGGGYPNYHELNLCIMMVCTLRHWLCVSIEEPKTTDKASRTREYRKREWKNGDGMTRMGWWNRCIDWEEQ